jgi:hypothetical protein
MAIPINLSSPGLTGRSSNPGPLIEITAIGDYWMPAYAGMTKYVGRRS